jgi:membrane protein implicated in regulation of membrane protease activity
VGADLVWLLLCVGLVVAELVTLTLVLGMLAVGALGAALAAYLGVGAAGQLLVFGGASTALLVVVRPPVRRALDRSGTSERTDPRQLAGSAAVVVQRVSDDTGQVRLNGELWRARPYAGTGPIDVGSPATVAAVDGATLLVYSPDLN